MVFRIALHNCGHTPAVGVNIRPVLYVLNNAKPHPVEERKRMCEELAKGGMAGETIFPGNEMVRTYTMNALAADIQRSVTPAGGYYAMNLILCIAYRSTFAEKAATCYYTGIVYDLRRNSPSYQGAFIINQGVHASALRVSESVFFGQIAT